MSPDLSGRIGRINASPKDPVTPPQKSDTIIAMTADTNPFDRKIYAARGGQNLSLTDLLDYFVKAGSMRVSDLHMKVGCPPVYRVDGALQRMKGPPLDEETVTHVASCLLSDLERKALAETGAVDSSLLTDTMQFRLNCFRDSDGTAVAIRALNPTIPPIEQIGFVNNVWQDIVSKQQGLVLLTGITGAGKTTTICSLIDRIAKFRPCRIITLEDPIEYRITSQEAIVSQREVGRDVPDFARGLRDCLREDPDVIYVGEMRDRESAQWTLTAAETGHLVFSTLHTRDTRGSITRLLDMAPTNQQDEVANQLSLGLSHIISQKLVPRADGRGRVVVQEILTNMPGVANLIRQRKVEQLRTHLQTRTRDVPAERMTTMERSLALRVAQGIITVDEARKWADDIPSFADELKRVQRGSVPAPPPL